MAQNKDLRKQSSVPTTPSESAVVTYYANASGSLHLVNSAGTIYPVNTFVTSNVSNSGQAAGAAGAITGGAILGSVAYWVSGNVNGVKVVFPAYVASF
jgi:hypothetical protein